MATKQDDIRDAACAVIREHPGGIRYSDLQRILMGLPAGWKPNTIAGSIWDLEEKRPNDVIKPMRGIYAPAGTEITPPPEPTPPPSIKESDFYQPFADFLVQELEVTTALPLGGSISRTRWDTPDVIGAYKRTSEDRVAFFGELLAAEIKIDPQEYVTAFGQALSYRLFAARTYIVMPKNMSTIERARLDALCMLFGVGFILFDFNKDEPKWEIRARAQRYSPDVLCQSLCGHAT